MSLNFLVPDCFFSAPPLLAIDGLKLLVFGGDNSVKANGDMFIFDTANYTWTKAATSPSPRTEMACTSAGEYFVTWGGTADSFLFFKKNLVKDLFGSVALR